MTTKTRFLGTLMMLVTAAAPLSAQSPVRLSLSGGVDASYRVQSRGPVGVTSLRGIGASGTGVLVVGPVLLRAAYGETFFEVGSLAVPGASAELVEAEAFAGLVPVSWFAIWAGPHVRTYTTPAGDTRWLLWEAHAQVRAALVPNWLDSYIEGWGAAGPRALGDEAFGTGRGARTGIAFRLFDPSVWVNLSYRIEHLSAADRRETVEVLSVRVEGRP